MYQQNKIKSCNSEVQLHTDILDALFKYKKEIYYKLSDIRGTYNIDHIAINIVTPENKLIILSISPSVEYNLIIQNLWQYDKSFFPQLYKENEFFYWEEAYLPGHNNLIRALKQEKHNYHLGIGLTRRLDDLYLTYSFATRNPSVKLKSYYLERQSELLLLGDYAFKCMDNIYKKFHTNISTPKNGQPLVKNSHLKLVVNND